MASQKHWQDECKDDISDDIDLGDEGSIMDQEECEQIFVEQCQEWLKNNAATLLNDVWRRDVYKKPWTKKSVNVPETPTKKSSAK